MLRDKLEKRTKCHTRELEKQKCYLVPNLIDFESNRSRGIQEIKRKQSSRPALHSHSALLINFAITENRLTLIPSGKTFKTIQHRNSPSKYPNSDAFVQVIKIKTNAKHNRTHLVFNPSECEKANIRTHKQTSARMQREPLGIFDETRLAHSFTGFKRTFRVNRELVFPCVVSFTVWPFHFADSDERSTRLMKKKLDWLVFVVGNSALQCFRIA